MMIPMYKKLVLSLKDFVAMALARLTIMLIQS